MNKTKDNSKEPSKDSSIMLRMPCLGTLNVGSSYGIFGEAFQASSTRDGIGVVGKAITNSASTNHRSDRGLGLGPVAGVYAITGTTGTSLVAQTTALHALNTTVYGAESYGAWIETVAGPTSIVPLKVVHAGTEIFRVGSNGDVLVNVGGSYSPTPNSDIILSKKTFFIPEFKIYLLSILSSLIIPKTLLESGKYW